MFKVICILFIAWGLEAYAKDEAQSFLRKADQLAFEGKFEKALEVYEQCLNHKFGSTDEEKEIYSENCQLHKARILFKAQRFDEANEAYDNISKKSYLWPLTIIERAWIAYKKKDYNRTLGLLATYKSPLLKSYFIPEVEVLNALSYFRLCLWDDSFTIVQDFEVQEAQAKELKKWINQKSYLTFNLDSAASFDTIPYGRTLWLQLLHRPWIKTETEKRTAFVELANFLIAEVERSSLDLFNISLELYTKKKSLIYKKERLISDRYRGDLSNVQRRADQYFWDFRGEFFADELGDYSFGLKSNCQTVSKGAGYESK